MHVFRICVWKMILILWTSERPTDRPNERERAHTHAHSHTDNVCCEHDTPTNSCDIISLVSKSVQEDGKKNNNKVRVLFSAAATATASLSHSLSVYPLHASIQLNAIYLCATIYIHKRHIEEPLKSNTHNVHAHQKRRAMKIFTPYTRCTRRSGEWKNKKKQKLFANWWHECIAGYEFHEFKFSIRCHAAALDRQLLFYFSLHSFDVYLYFRRTQSEIRTWLHKQLTWHFSEWTLITRK